MGVRPPTVGDVPAFQVYGPLEAPEVEVEIEGQWWSGDVRMRTRRRDGRVTSEVRFHREGST